MTLDADLLRAAREQRDRLRGLQRDMAQATDAFHRQIRRLYEAGGSPWEIADSLGLTDEQVGTILGSAAGVRTAAAGPPGGSASGPGTGPGPPAPGGPARPFLACSFCGAVGGPRRRLVAGTGVAVCDRCVRLALEVVVEGEDREPDLRLVDDAGPEQALACSFCSKPLRRVGRLVRGRGGIHVCGECLDLSAEILRQWRS
jgi:hypothetical protein